MSDEDLGERQKQVLLDIYDSFRRENSQQKAEAAREAALAEHVLDPDADADVTADVDAPALHASVAE